MNKLLVANRSEIACRVFQACRERGISTVGIYAPGDEQARHVTFADEVYRVESYLNIDEIIQIAKKVGVTLIHPGYGFLSERPQFAEAVEKVGIQFLGPLASTMKLMGEKVASKELIEKIKVPTLPWEKVASVKDVAQAAKKVGFPLLIKASAGGGGKGMRKVLKEEDLISAAESAMREVESSFGNPEIFIEKLVTHPRHIEVQVFGDGQGKGIHLFERECSLQRRHQKIWEEAPAMRLSEKTKKGLYEAALKIVEETKYRSAGTIEFLVDENEGFYFLEMNTRLQVEHPVSENITGIDLVCAQIDLALQQKIPAQPQTIRGHSIEVRIYAEDPAQGFIPQSGTITSLTWPTGVGIRVDSGVEEGQTIHTLFDSMCAKLIVRAETREHAIERLKFALEETSILGIGHNQLYLRSLCDHPFVREAKVYTGFLENEFKGFAPELSDEEKDVLTYLVQNQIGRKSNQSTSDSKAEFPSPWFEAGLK